LLRFGVVANHLAMSIIHTMDRATCFALIHVQLSNVTLGWQTSCIRQGQLNLEKAKVLYSYKCGPIT